jgi:hypothetical protein
MKTLALVILMLSMSVCHADEPTAVELQCAAAAVAAANGEFTDEVLDTYYYQCLENAK